jgi:group I intron endonuclease
MAQGIYKIINVVNNKFYVGSAVDFKRRKARHFSELRNKKHNNQKLQNAWNKYGEQAFVFVIVEELELGVDILAAETIWLREHVGKDYCYNIGVDAIAPMLGMRGTLSPTWGRKRTSDELRAQNWTGKKHRVESIEKIRNYLLGKPKSTATRAKISASLSGEKNFNYGKPRTQAFKDKVSKQVIAIAPDKLETAYASITELRTALDMKPATINRALKSGRPLTRGPYTGWSFAYK